MIIAGFRWNLYLYMRPKNRFIISMKHYILGLLLLTVFSCLHDNSPAVIERLKDPELGELYRMMQGSYDSESQAKTDASFSNISMHIYPIWADQGHYFYAEQALTSMQTRPYLQRIYQIKRLSDSSFASFIYKIPQDSLWIGSWKNPERFEAISPSSLIKLEGCEVILKRISEQSYLGTTRKNSCESILRGASFSFSEVEICKDKIVSWDRGYDASGKQVWGSNNGAYIFQKLK